jgi:uncharacterized coiled-coil DUF342 family protein
LLRLLHEDVLAFTRNQVEEVTTSSSDAAHEELSSGNYFHHEIDAYRENLESWSEKMMTFAKLGTSILTEADEIYRKLATRLKPQNGLSLPVKDVEKILRKFECLHKMTPREILVAAGYSVNGRAMVSGYCVKTKKEDVD